MNVGLPGTGLGGLFYLLAALIMPFVEIVQTVRGRSSRTRWWLVARQWIFVSLILLVFTGEFWLLEQILTVSQRLSPGMFTQGQQIFGTGELSPIVIALIPFVTLALLMLAIEVFALFRRWRKHRYASAQGQRERQRQT
ncbi:MAG: hypothetical protein KF893_09665 [Caldilineaceae bacterium]|nr:hypothetical protein [Caldilineaceae bacterium]